MTNKHLIFKSLVLIIVLVGFYSCHPVPEVSRTPVLSSFWDTLGPRRKLLFPGDSLVISADLASQTENNTLYFQAIRLALPYTEYLGPDSDFVFQATQSVFQKITTGYLQKILIPEGLRPGKYQITTLGKDNEGRFSDTIKSSFFLESYYYPVLAMGSPKVDGSITRIDTAGSDTARFSLVAAGVDMDYLQFQWFDSTKVVPLSPPYNRNLVGRTVPLVLDSFLNTNAIIPKRITLRILLRETDKREMYYWLPYKKSL